MSIGRNIIGGLVGIALVVFIVGMLNSGSFEIPGVSGSDGTISPPPVAPDSTVIDAACIITITNSLATYYEEPGFNQLQVGSVPTGRYGVSDIRVVDFAGQMQRWFYIQADGQPGWIRDETFFVDSKEGTCR